MMNKLSLKLQPQTDPWPSERTSASPLPSSSVSGRSTLRLVISAADTYNTLAEEFVEIEVVVSQELQATRLSDHFKTWEKIT
jgi:hypothetical protein